MVSVTILLILGGTLIMVLRQGLSTWRVGETRRVTYEEGVHVLDRLGADLRNVFARDPLGSSTRARFLADRRWMVFTRTFPGEASDPLAGLSGLRTGGEADLDRVDDREEAMAGELRAVGGLQEVAWVHVPGERSLYRAVRAPAGGEGSLFEADLANPGSDDRFRRVSGRVLHVEWRFWGAHTTTWDPTVPPRTGDGAESGPLPRWDSTRALLPSPGGLPDDVFRFFRAEGSLFDPADDVVPRRVEIRLTVAEEGPGARLAFLRHPPDRPVDPTMEEPPPALEADDEEIHVDVGARFPREGGWARIEDEWVRLESVRGDVLHVAPDGRGARGTEAVDHARNAPVEAGETFSVVCPVPAARDRWSDGS